MTDTNDGPERLAQQMVAVLQQADGPVRADTFYYLAGLNDPLDRDSIQRMLSSYGDQALQAEYAEACADRQDRFDDLVLRPGDVSEYVQHIHLQGFVSEGVTYDSAPAYRFGRAAGREFLTRAQLALCGSTPAAKKLRGDIATSADKGGLTIFAASWLTAGVMYVAPTEVAAVIIAAVPPLVAFYRAFGHPALCAELAAALETSTPQS